MSGQRSVRSCGRGCGRPYRIGFGSEEPKRRAGDQVTLVVEGVVDGGVGGEESLGGTLGLELLLFAFPSSYRGKLQPFAPPNPPHSQEFRDKLALTDSTIGRSSRVEVGVI